MRVRILVQLTALDGSTGDAEELTCFEKETNWPEDLGLPIGESKSVLEGMQRRIVQKLRHPSGRRNTVVARLAGRRSKGSYPVVFQSLFGDVPLSSPRLYRCRCAGADSPAARSRLRRCGITGLRAPISPANPEPQRRGSASPRR